MSWKTTIATIWVGQSVSLLTSSILQMAIIWYLTIETGSATIVTLATLAAFLPQALLGPICGVIIDRVNNKLVLIFSDLFISLTAVALAYFAMNEQLSTGLIMFILVLRSIGNTFHEPTAQAITPLFVPKEHITRVAGFAQGFDSVSMLISPSLAIVLYEMIDIQWIFLLDALGAFVAITLLLTIPFPKKEKVERPPINLKRETLEGIAVMRAETGALPLAFVGFLFTVLYSPVGSLYPHITLNYFGGTTAQSGLVEIIFSLGSLFGAFGLGMLGDKMPKRLGVFGSIFVYGLGMFIIGTLPPTGYWIFVALSFFAGSSTPIYHGMIRAIYQKKIPQEYLGRVFTLTQSTRRLGMPVGLLLGGQFADHIGIEVLYVVAGGLAMALGVGASRVPSLIAVTKE
ncbi:MAG: MFS transporter [Eubacteriales bacterium]